MTTQNCTRKPAIAQSVSDTITHAEVRSQNRVISRSIITHLPDISITRRFSAPRGEDRFGTCHQRGAGRIN